MALNVWSLIFKGNAMRPTDAGNTTQTHDRGVRPVDVGVMPSLGLNGDVDRTVSEGKPQTTEKGRFDVDQRSKTAE
jgi:hypothetical protein